MTTLTRLAAIIIPTRIPVIAQVGHEPANLYTVHRWILERRDNDKLCHELYAPGKNVRKTPCL